MAAGEAPLTQIGFGRTGRRDRWWAQPLLTFLVLSSFVVYTTWAALQGDHYAFGNYLSPFYSPLLFGDAPHAWFGPRPGWWPGWLVFSPAPPSCAVGEPRKSYLGEASLPLILQNAHRFFLWVALIFLPILGHDVW